MRSLNLPDAEFRALARRLADFSADYLERMPQLAAYPPGISGRETKALFSGDIPWEGRGAAAFDCLDEVCRLSRPASPRFFGYVGINRHRRAFARQGPPCSPFDHLLRCAVDARSKLLAFLWNQSHEINAAESYFLRKRNSVPIDAMAWLSNT